MKTSRRTMLQHSSLGTLGVILPGCAAAQAQSPTIEPSSGGATLAYAAKPLPFNPAALPGLSETLLRSHHDNNYVGAVKKLSGVRQQLAALPSDAPGYVLHGLAQGELAFKHSVVLHELYFGNLVGGGSQGSQTTSVLAEHFGGAAVWEQRFVALGASLGGGSGWAILEYDLHEGVPRLYSAADHTQALSCGVPLLVLDMYEHSYHMDYGTAATGYIDAFFANIHWEEVDRRMQLATKLAQVLG